jgi:hypothetical protein
MLQEAKEKEKQIMEQEQIMKQQIEELMSIKEDFQKREKTLLKEIETLKANEK